MLSLNATKMAGWLALLQHGLVLSILGVGEVRNGWNRVEGGQMDRSGPGRAGDGDCQIRFPLLSQAPNVGAKLRRPIGTTVALSRVQEQMLLNFEEVSVVASEATGLSFQCHWSPGYHWLSYWAAHYTTWHKCLQASASVISWLCHSIRYS